MLNGECRSSAVRKEEFRNSPFTIHHSPLGAMDVRTLTGKTVLVTGAGSGIGRETALAFARRGADLVMCDVNEAAIARTAEDIRALGCKAASDVVDVADAAGMRAFADSVHAEVEAVDVLVNNAGVGLGSS